MIEGRRGKARRGAGVEPSSDAGSSDDARRITAMLAAALERRSPRSAARVACGLAVAVLAVDASVGFQISFLSLYAVPVALAAWAAPPRVAYTLAAVAVIIPVPLSAFAGEPVGSAVLWSIFSNFALLGVIVTLLITLKRRLSDEAAFMATDALTGLLMRGSFIASLDAELARAGPLDSIPQFFRGVAIPYRNGGLNDNRSPVQRFINKVDGTPADLDSPFQGLPLGVKP